VLNGGNSNYFVKEKIKMENYENKELLKEAAKQSLESLKDLKPGTDEYTNTAKIAAVRHAAQERRAGEQPEPERG
jgi:preprotein translocase subunit Sss1